MAKVTATITIPPAKIDAVYTLVRCDAPVPSETIAREIEERIIRDLGIPIGLTQPAPPRRRVYLGAGPEYRVIRQD